MSVVPQLLKISQNKGGGLVAVLSDVEQGLRLLQFFADIARRRGGVWESPVVLN